jgi:PhnB protein
MPSRLNPYLNFHGNAREAMEFYRSVLGGNLVATTFAEGGMGDQAADADNVMHGQLEVDNGMVLMGADAPPGTPAGAGPQITISLSGEDDAELSAYFEKLSEGGTIIEPLERAPWGDRFGMLTDRFGVTWLVNIAGTEQTAGAGAGTDAQGGGAQA